MQGIRAQAFTLEGLLAALVVLAGVVFAVQAVVVTPSSGGTTAAPVDVERLNSVLRTTAVNGSLRRAALAWEPSGFNGSDSVTYLVGELPNASFGQALNQTFDAATTVNVKIHHGGANSPQRMVYNGLPGDGAVRATTVVVIYDSDLLRNGEGNPQVPARTVEQADTNNNFYVEDQFSGHPVYDVFKIEVVAWQP